MNIHPDERTLQRRDFLLATATAIAATGGNAKQLAASDSSDSTRVPLGLDYSLRGMKCKATKLIEFAV